MHPLTRLLLVAVSLLLLSACRQADTDPADTADDTSSATVAPTHQLAARQAIIAGDPAAALTALQAAVSAGEPCIDPVTLCGGWASIRDLHSFPDPATDPAARSIQTALDAFIAGSDTTAVKNLLSAMADGEHPHSEAFTLYALHGLRQGKLTVAIGGISKAEAAITDTQDPEQVWLDLVARVVAYDRDARPATSTRCQELLTKAKFHPQRSAIASFYAARQDLIDANTADAELHLGEAISVWGPEFVETGTATGRPDARALPHDLDSVDATDDL